MIVRSQNTHIAIRKEQINKTEIQKKDNECWIIVGVLKNNSVLTLARYPSEKEALAADNGMWLSEDQLYTYPIFPGGNL